MRARKQPPLSLPVTHRYPATAGRAGWWHLTTAMTLALLLGGCGNSENMHQSEVEYLSHMDQAQFFKRQGELRASTQELRSAISLMKQEAEPRYLLIENLLTAGDGVTAKVQLEQLRAYLADTEQLSEQNLNRLQLLKAEAYLVQERHESTLGALQQITGDDPHQQLEARVLTGDAYRQQMRYDLAEEAYQSALEMDEQALLPLLGLSRCRFAQDDQEGAKKWLEQARELDDNHSEVWLWRAQMAHREGDLRLAREGYSRALEDIGRYDVMTQRKYVTIAALIDVLQRKGNASEAFVYEEMLANSAPGTIQANLEAARDQYQRGNLERAAAHLEELLSQSPGQESASILLGMIRFQQGRAEAAEQLLAPFAENQQSAELTKMLAATRIRLQRSDEAVAMLEKLDPEQSDPAVTALVGIASLAGGDYEMGQQLIESSLKKQPDNSDLRARYARYLISQNMLAKAKDQLHKGIELAEESDDLRILLAQLYLQTGEQEAAVKLTEEWREQQPRNIRAISTSGDVAQALGETEQAKRLYHKALKVDDSGFESHFALGALEARSGNREQALEHIRDAVKAAPEQEAPLNTLLGLTRNEPQQLSQNMEFLQALTRDQEQAIRPRLVLLEYHLQQDQQSEANTQVDELVSLIDNPERSERLIGATYQNAANQALRNNQQDQAQKLLRLGRDRYRHHEGLALVDARLQFQRNQARDAREILRNVKTHYPDSPGPYLTEGNHLMSQGQYRQAAEQFSLARKKAETPVTLVRLAQAKRHSGQSEQSLALLKMADERFPDNEQILLNIAMAHQTAGKDQESIHSYERTLAVAPNNAVALNNLAWLYHEQGREGALFLAERAYRLQPQTAEIADTYGWILLSQGNVDESIHILEQARSIDPDSADINRHLKEAYRKAGRDDDADALQTRF